MKFQLADVSKIGWLKVGEALFTYDEPGPIEVCLEDLTPYERNQFLYSCRRGALECSDPKELIKICDVVQPVPVVAKPVAIAPPPKKKEIGEVMKDEEKTLKKILLSSVITVKQEATTLTSSKLRKLLALEKKGKKRKSVLTFCDSLLKNQNKEVARQVGAKDIAGKITPVGLAAKTSPNVSSIVESDEEEIIFNPLEV